MTPVKQALRVSRRHGLGDVVMIVPLLRARAALGVQVLFHTRPEWASALQELAPDIEFVAQGDASFLDLDQCTITAPAEAHRHTLFRTVLGLTDEAAIPLSVPESWQSAWRSAAGCTLFAPDAAHESRRCPAELARQIGERLADTLVVVGQAGGVHVPCREDLRGKTELRDLIALVAVAGRILSMDSAMLHIAAMLGRPTVALFGGIEPLSRTDLAQRVVVLVGDVPCRPCNKNETCEGRYDCLAKIRVDDVVDALDACITITHREIRVVV